MIKPLIGHQKFKFKVNKLDSNHKRDLPPAHIDTLINYAVRQFLEIFYAGNNAKRYNLGFEVTQQRIDMLSDLVVKYPLQPSLVPVEIDTGIYEIKLRDLKFEYCHLLRAFIDSDCGTINVAVKQHDDMNMLLNDEFQKPSLKWKRVLTNIAKSSDGEGSSLYLYTGGLFSIDEVKLEYLKAPNKMFFGGYDTIEYLAGDEDAPNKDSESISVDISDKYCDLIIAIAAQEFDRIQGDVQMLNLRTDEVQTIS